MPYVKIDDDNLLELKKTSITGVLYDDVVELCVKELIRDEMLGQGYNLEYQDKKALLSSTYEDVLEHGTIDNLEYAIRDSLDANYARISSKM